MTYLDASTIGHCRRPISWFALDGLLLHRAEEAQAAVALLAEALLAALRAHALADAHAFAARRAEQQYVGGVDRHLLRQPAALLIAAARTHVPVDAVDPFDHHLADIRQHAQHAARRGRVVAGDDLHGVVFANVHGSSSPISNDLSRQADNL